MSEDPRSVAAVTGAARGIGAAIASRFAQDLGWSVRGYDVLDAEDGTGGATGAYVVEHSDVASEESVIASVEALDARYGRIDALVNVAGIVVVKPLTDVTWDEFDRLIKVNLGGVFLWCKHVIPIMKRQGGGVIVNMASVSGHVGQVDHVLYGATKGAILSFTRALAWELAPFNIRVVSVSPGSVDTEMLRSDIRSESVQLDTPFDELKVLREGEQALGRWASAAEIAEPVFFLANHGGSFITGADLLVDGGWTAR
jgi:NAD(P)-dependent dehydrogenase (short-subunit alcohol dehydrogenase family)